MLQNQKYRIFVNSFLLMKSFKTKFVEIRNCKHDVYTRILAMQLHARIVCRAVRENNRRMYFRYAIE